jgi:uncharacterized membrane protein YsdA (DUF1294 family)/cold shock CspA family protein
VRGFWVCVFWVRGFWVRGFWVRGFWVRRLCELVGAFPGGVNLRCWIAPRADRPWGNFWIVRMPQQGRLCTWKPDNGYGFITADAGGPDVFVHIRDLFPAEPPPQVGERVAYELTTDRQGRLRVKSALRLEHDPRGLEGNAALPESPRSGRFLPTWVFVVVFGVAMSALTVTDRLPWPVIALYSGMSLVTFLCYAHDKSAAEQKAWRVRESTLHLLAFAGGWPGALVAQHVLRHKCSKHSFQWEFWFLVACNCLILELVVVPELSGTLWQLLKP